MSADPPISREVFELQLALLGLRDTGHTSAAGDVKLWVDRNDKIYILSNHDFVPANVFHRLLRELGASGLGVYGTP